MFLLEYFASVPDDERRLLMPLLATPVTRKPWRVYLRWLEQRGDPRAEVLELALALADGDGGEAKRARLRELLEHVELAWWRLVQPAPRVFNCASEAAASEPPRVRFTFECPRSWETMMPTANPGVRRCDGCDADVHDCATIRDAAVHAQLGRCIRVPPEVTAPVYSELTRNMVGRPDRPALWAARLFPDDERTS